MPRFTKKKWNTKYVKNSHNCYSYMLNKINKRYVKMCKRHMKKTKNAGCGFLKAQPGLYSGMKDVKNHKNYNCKVLNRRILADNKNMFKTKKKCPKKHYKGMLFIDPKKTYHFYRQDSDGLWSHKAGSDKTTRRDSRRRKIKNPKKSSRRYLPTKMESGVYYSRSCGTYCIPESKRKKFFSPFTRKKTSKAKRKTIKAKRKTIKRR